MKRIISLLAVSALLLCLCACSPDNIKTPEPSPAQNTPAPAPSPAPAPAEEKTENVIGFVNTDKKQANKNLLPEADVNTLGFVNTDLLKDKSLTVFALPSKDFAAGKSLKEFFAAVSEKYGCTVVLKTFDKSTLFSAVKSASYGGKAPDLVICDTNDMVSFLPMLKQTELPENIADAPFDEKFFQQTDGKLFAAIGNNKLLWYNKSLVNTDKLSELVKGNNFTVQTIKETVTDGKADVICTDGDVAGILNTANEKATVFGESITENISKTGISAAAKEYLNVTVTQSADRSFEKGNVAYIYADKPVCKDITIGGFVPLPKSEAEGEDTVAVTGNAIGVLENTENADAANTLAMLWCARYTENGIDRMLFDMKLAKETVTEYLGLVKEKETICSFDKKLTDLISGDLTKLSTEGDRTEIAKRTELINARYR